MFSKQIIHVKNVNTGYLTKDWIRGGKFSWEAAFFFLTKNSAFAEHSLDFPSSAFRLNSMVRHHPSLPQTTHEDLFIFFFFSPKTTQNWERMSCRASTTARRLPSRSWDITCWEINKGISGEKKKKKNEEKQRSRLYVLHHHGLAVCSYELFYKAAINSKFGSSLIPYSSVWHLTQQRNGLIQKKFGSQHLQICLVFTCRKTKEAPPSSSSTQKHHKKIHYKLGGKKKKQQASAMSTIKVPHGRRKC